MALDIADVSRRLGPAFAVEYLPEVCSTNDLALQRARDGAPAGAVIVADFQTAGRGRRGARWIAPAGTCVLVSLLVRPKAPLPPDHLVIITGAGAAAGLRALEVPALIRWPNDLIVADRKVGGILLETAGEAVVIGIGVNCALPEEAIPHDLRGRAGSLQALLGREMRREDVLVAVLQGVVAALARLEAGDIAGLVHQWNGMNWLAGRRVRVLTPAGLVDGDGLYLDAGGPAFQVVTGAGVVTLPLSCTVEVR